MRNPPFPEHPGKSGTLRELLENPVFANIVRAFLLLLLSLGVYIWKTELGHVTDALREIKMSVNASLAQQREELKALRQEVAGTNREVDRVLLRSSELIWQLYARHGLKAPDGEPPPQQAGKR